MDVHAFTFRDTLVSLFKVETPPTGRCPCPQAGNVC